MVFATGSVLAVLLFIVVVIGGGIALQIFFSRMERRWPGLILPILTFGYSLLGLFGYAAFDGMVGWQVALQLFVLMLMLNIPTFVLLAIYFACREKRKRDKQIEKMNIQEL